MEQIKTAIAPMFETKNALEEAAMNIFLTMKGVRPACMPFDIEGGHDELMKRFHENPDDTSKFQRDFFAEIIKRKYRNGSFIGSNCINYTSCISYNLLVAVPRTATNLFA